MIEGPKKALFFQGRRSSEKLRRLSKDLFDLKKPDAQMLTKKNDITVFENVTPVEAFCKKHESPVFVMTSHSKKRPDNLVIGRMFNHNLLDMVELHVENIEGMKAFACSKIVLGTKPSLVFNGPAWEETEVLKHLKSIFIDIFHREEVDSVRLQGLEHTISFTATPEGKILIRSYKVLLKKSGCRAPRVELEEMGESRSSIRLCRYLTFLEILGPRIDLSLRRSKLPTEDLMKEALRKPRELKVTKKKNVSVDKLGTTHGRIHVGKQEINRIQTRKMKGLKKTVDERKLKRAAKLATAENNNVNNKMKKQKLG